jgi:cellulose synthase/poly-beta-1,6-N-acetylglucosamine synthase-like glycosyltransferase
MTELDKILGIVLWLCAAVVAYHYVVYPVLIWVLAKCFGRVKPPQPLKDEELPTISILIAAHNEEAMIGKRMTNALELDYPADKMEIVVGSDGSTDGTARIVRSFADPRIRLLEYQENRGKASVLNSSMDELKNQIVIFSDANTFFERDAARLLVRWLRDPAVGVVCGKLVLTEAATGKNVDSMYWRYETFLKKSEGALGALLGSNGAIYALRRELFVPIPGNTIVDDFVIPLLAKLRSDCGIIYDADAVAHEETAPDIAAEFRRRSRIGAGGFQAIGMLWPLLNPMHGWVAMSFFSHKVLRWLCPFALLGALISNVLLVNLVFYRWTLAAQAAFYVLAMLGPYVPGRNPLVKLLRVATMFTSMNAALLMGFWMWLRGSQKGAWRRTARSADAAGQAKVASVSGAGVE